MLGLKLIHVGERSPSCLGCISNHTANLSSDLLPWWRHQMETFSALLAFCAGNSPVPGEFPAQRPVTRSFGVFFDLRPNKRLSKQWWGWWFETLSCPLWRHSNGYNHVWLTVRPFATSRPVWFKPQSHGLTSMLQLTRDFRDLYIYIYIYIYTEIPGLLYDSRVKMNHRYTAETSCDWSLKSLVVAWTNFGRSNVVGHAQNSTHAISITMTWYWAR